MTVNTEFGLYVMVQRIWGETVVVVIEGCKCSVRMRGDERGIY